MPKLQERVEPVLQVFDSASTNADRRKRLDELDMVFRKHLADPHRPADPPVLSEGPANWVRKLRLRGIQLCWNDVEKEFIKIKSRTLANYVSAFISSADGKQEFSQVRATVESEAQNKINSSVKRQISELNGSLKPLTLNIDCRQLKAPDPIAVLATEPNVD